ncbi:hypothetical protein J437_LFUL010540 [Ladona fulva]|uniref:Uncharacterized protein n=1 Tax=Ladona fulva TaxID=123851 RepID=A0A8K0K612_LADFU|nr:hypothetical protein J437_LFUL010540 [Ladona fulva]
MRFLLSLLLVVCVFVPLVRSLPALYLNDSELEGEEPTGFEDSEDYYDETPEEDRLFEPNDEPEEVVMFEAVTMDTNLLASEEACVNLSI